MIYQTSSFVSMKLTCCISKLHPSTQLPDAMMRRDQVHEQQMMMSHQTALWGQRALLHGMALGGAQSGDDTVNILRTVNSERLSVNLGASSNTQQDSNQGEDKLRLQG